jgi:hypothetical protein
MARATVDLQGRHQRDSRKPAALTAILIYIISRLGDTNKIAAHLQQACIAARAHLSHPRLVMQNISCLSSTYIIIRQNHEKQVSRNHPLFRAAVTRKAH